ncbi:hypothetical protein KVT40_000711 [Elsinoe batatas]|uniref:Chalcone isomerase domain-containing protein n=1 Tax=Elsinoe batatas TaxID=2601811 RepID=A0A8K0L7U0_9PEZI|nr:hypothetical protein KVT40_000711 [Elsinoe batatas]
MSRPAMRMLSSRWQQLQPLTAATRTARLGCRCSSRYSQPGVRSAATALNASTSAEQASSDPYIKDERQHKLRRIRYASWGLFFSVLGTGIVTNVLISQVKDIDNKKAIQLDSSSDKDAKFQGLPVHTIGAGDDKRIVAEGPQDIDLVETGTSSVPYFPKTIFLPTTSLGSTQPNTTSNPGNLRNDEEYTLIGLGIRTVSFLSIQVYVMGLYVRNADLSVLQKRLIHYINSSASTLVPSEKEELRAALSDPTKSTEIWHALLASTDIKSAWRISPTRNTDFAHLRDGWITGIKKGTQAAQAAVQAKASGPVGTEYDSEEFGDAVKRFKDIFHGGGKAAKGSVVTLARDEKGGMNIYFEDPKAGGKQEKLGTAKDGRVSKLIWLGYLAGKNVSSEAARKGVAEGLLTLTARPVGSAETMVT